MILTPQQLEEIRARHDSLKGHAFKFQADATIAKYLQAAVMDRASLLSHIAAQPVVTGTFREGVEAAANVAEDCRMVGPSFIGPLHGSGWNGAVAAITERIRAMPEPGRGKVE